MRLAMPRELQAARMGALPVSDQIAVLASVIRILIIMEEAGSTPTPGAILDGIRLEVEHRERMNRYREREAKERRTS